MTVGRAAFERAVADYGLTDHAPPVEALAVAAGSLDRTGLFLLGEAHGVAQTPLAILGLARRLGVRALAFEWPSDELDDVVQPVLSAGAIDSAPLGDLEPVGLLIEEELPGVANGILASSAGTIWFHGEHESPFGELPRADVVVPLGVACPAAVPQLHVAARSALGPNRPESA